MDMQSVIFQNWNIFLLSTVFFFLLDESFVQVFGLHSPYPGRFNCYTNEQQGCSPQEFTDVYPEFSRSADNLTMADTYFHMFTKQNPDCPEKLHKCGGRLPNNTNFNSENDIIVIMVPYLADFCITAIYREWMHAIFKRGDYNVMIIDWGWGNKVKYETAVKNLRIAAKQSVIVLKNIQKDQHIIKEQVYLIGHSLAAHGLGFIGQDFPVRRITAIDPANGGFSPYEVPPEDRLDPSDADFVDVWHCNAGDCAPYFGIAYDIGHVNFWVNDGTHQPGCHRNAFNALLKKDYILGLYTSLSPQACNHVHCADYFRASINPKDCEFIGVKCDNYDDFMAGKCDSCGENGENCLVMGFDSKDYKNRKFNIPERYYLSTKKTCPYCVNSKIQHDGCKQKEESPAKYASNSDGNSHFEADMNKSLLHRMIDFAKWLLGSST